MEISVQILPLLSLNLPPSALIDWLKKGMVIGVDVGGPVVATLRTTSVLRSGAFLMTKGCVGTSLVLLKLRKSALIQRLEQELLS